MKPLPGTDRQRLYEDRTEHTGWPGLAVWGMAFWSSDHDDEPETRPFGGPDRSLWDRLGIHELTGIGPDPQERR